MRGCVLLAALLVLCGPVLGTHVGVVMFSARGITGYIRFTEINETSTQIVANLMGLPGAMHNWHVHTLPIDQTRDPAVQCLSVWAGPHYDPFNARLGLNATEYAAQCTQDTPLGCEAGDLAGKFGRLDSGGQIDVTDTTGQLVLDGRYSIIGRSVVIHAEDGTNFECGTIRSVEDNMMGATVLQATFISPVAGTIYFRQTPGDAVHMWGKLYWVNDFPETMNHNWHIHERAPEDDTYRVGMCSSVGQHYDPTGNGPTSAPGYNVSCTPDTPAGCEIGDLTGKHDTISISATPANYATNSFFFTDVFLNLTGVYAVEGRSVVIHEANRGGPMIACAPLVASETISLNNYLYNYISASQQSPFDDTVFTRNAGPSASFSILNSALSPNAICPTDSSSVTFDSTYNPYTVENVMNTPDRFPLGDLQNRYSSNLMTTGTPFRVFDMPVYGPDVTISGLTLRADLGANNRQCGAFIPDLSGEGVFAAKATFTGTVNGNILFVQRYNANGILGNTSTHVYVDIYYATERSQTTGHNWHVHMNPPQSGQNCTSAIGGHYNPFGVSLANMNDQNQPSMNSNYRDDCSPIYPLRCESGDLSNKHGQLSIASPSDGRPTYTYVDNNLYLTGTYSIVDRSIGLHLPSSEGGALFDCAPIRRFYISGSYLSVQFPMGQFDRIGVVRMMTDGTNVDPSDVLVLAQEVLPVIIDGNTVVCANVTMRVLGGTQMDADTNYGTVQPNVASFRCSGPLTVAPLSLLLLAACLLLALVY